VQANLCNKASWNWFFTFVYEANPDSFRASRACNSGHVIISDNKKLPLPSIVAAFPWTRLCGGEHGAVAFGLKKHKLAEGWGRGEWGIANWIFLGFKELG
jgi:hypothetical protein